MKQPMTGTVSRTGAGQEIVLRVYTRELRLEFGYLRDYWAVDSGTGQLSNGSLPGDCDITPLLDWLVLGGRMPDGML